MDLLIKLGEASARDIQSELPDPPTYSAVRSILRILGQKSLVTKVKKDGRDLYTPAVPVEQARISALQAVVKSFFSNSAVEAACALLGNQKKKISPEEAEMLQKLIEEAKKR